ncbi:MAG TPA: hypothetical protein VHG09_05425 [Longimicrobiales bacterium]|nr:hypothetical protein [Longimicrobiales bacterium]
MSDAQYSIRTHGIRSRLVRWAQVLAMLLVVSGCDRIWPERADLTLPDTAVVESYYARHGFDAEFRYSGNVLEIVVQQPADQLRRGGALWARVGPYIYVFAPATRDLMEQHHGIAGVRAITMVGDVEVARAMLVRDELNEVTWPRAINILAAALERGTERPSTMDALARFGEEHTTFEYNPDYVPPRERAGT